MSGSSPPSKWKSNNPQGYVAGSRGASSQLLQELEALSQSLYKSQKKDLISQSQTQPEPQPQPQPQIHHGLSSRRSESLPVRRFNQYTLNEEVIMHHDPIPLPGLVPRDPPPSIPSPRSRHSMSVQHSATPPFNPQNPDHQKTEVKANQKADRKAESGYSQPRFSFSMLPSPRSPLWGSELTQDVRPQSSSVWGSTSKQDIRSRNDRRFSIQPLRANNVEVPEKSYVEEPGRPEESPDTVRKSDHSSDKKKKAWNNWKPLRALSHIGRNRLHCVFSAYVHAIEGLPAAMTGLRLCVHMRKAETKEGAVQSMPSRVFQGVADIRENLFIKCTLFSSKGHSSNSKFMDKSVIVSVISPDIEELDFGKHQLDLSRLMSDLVDDKTGQLERGNSWDTTLDLTGKAKGAKLVITFNYEVLDKDPVSGSISGRFPDSPPHHRSQSSRNTSFSLPNSAHGTPRLVPKRAHLGHSPAASDPGDDYDGLLAIDHLNLEEPSSKAVRQETRREKTVEGRSSHVHANASSQDGFNAILPVLNPEIISHQRDQGFPSRAPSTTGKDEFVHGSYENLNPISQEEEEVSSDDDAEFSVVEKGMEINDSINVSLTNEEENPVIEKHEDSSDLPSAASNEKGVQEDSASKMSNDHLISDTTKMKASESAASPERRSLGDKLNHEDGMEVVPVDDKKSSVTYQTLMHTLDSLLQGTSMKEHSQDLSGETMATDTPKSPDDNEDLTDEQVIKPSLFLDEPKASDIEVSIHKSQDITGDLREGSEDIDNEAELVAGEFLDMLDLGDTTMDVNYDSDSNSPRARLLKQFEQEALMQGSGLDLPFSDLMLDEPSNIRTIHEPSSGINSSHVVSYTNEHNNEETDNLSTIMELAESELEWATQHMKSKTRAKLLEDAEAEALMQKWGLNEEAFTSSPPKPKAKQQDPPPLGKGLGASVPLKDGGSLRSMDPSHFQANKSSGKLVMQMSKPVVVPAEMGSEAVDILCNMASLGVENMALQAMTAMPLEDIAGRPVEHVAAEGLAAAKSRHRALEGPLKGILGKELNWNAQKSPTMTGEFLSLEDLAPMAMQQIEALAIDGLKVQSNIEEEEAPYTLNAFQLDDQLDGKRNTHNVKGVTGVYLSKGSNTLTEVSSNEGGKNRLMDMAIGLDEWMLLDAGLYDEVETNKDTMAIMAAHHANHQEQALVTSEDKKKKKENAKARWGRMGNTITIAMLVQLRDPLRNNEAVGVPMMAFVQAERVVKPPKLKVGRNISLKGNTEEEDESENKKEEVIPEFKVIGVHMAGLKAPEDEEVEKQKRKKTVWGNEKQQQTGSRWLLANGMSKNTKSHHPLLTSKSTKAPSQVKVNKGESLWSISARVNGSGSKWKDMLKLNPHIRNPDVIYENQTIRTR